MSALALAAFAVTAAVMTAPVPAAAHPFGDPQTVDVARDEQRPDVVRVRWRVGGPDDLTLLGVSLGLLPEDRVLPDGNVDYQYSDPGLVGASTQFPAYLLERITVTGDGKPCVGRVEPPRALARAGATAEFTCPGPVSTATVRMRMLTDLNSAYRALATGPDGQREVYDSAQESHDWVLTGGPASTSANLGRSAAVQLAAVAVGAVPVVVVALVLFRRSNSRRKVAA
ncbi:hypothetical protein E1211_25640 [Micromonospora sp. 15K316]|uniref:hypothetical protein n=1 Tax=Micromonospora sp. 15K316 TaxID=2530376 RepID=UPI0010502D11|nr:hypothetical protein [Micromonospora sp. 15K316]TDC29631.1 hypothetical protein E1211_25640 [Micromonospora sp. 15K316]